MATTDVALDYQELAHSMKALGYPMRLRLLDRLRLPHTLREIRMRPGRSHGGADPQRPASRQSVERHLQRLADVGLITTDKVVEGRRRVYRYAVNPTRVFTFMEDVRRLCSIYVGTSASRDETGTFTPESVPYADPTSTEPKNPGLRLVRGLYEGRHYPLDSTKDGRWIIGRGQDADIRLDYDPFVSTHNTVLRFRHGGFEVEDLGSKNGSHVDWQPLPPGGRRVVGPGSVLGVGRSLLVLRS